MADPGDQRGDLEAVLELAAQAAGAYLAEIDEQPVAPPGGLEALAKLEGPLPEQGAGAPDAVRTLAQLGQDAATRSAGPRFFHFVMGGGTPAALAADWLTLVVVAVEQVVAVVVSGHPVRHQHVGGVLGSEAG